MIVLKWRHALDNTPRLTMAGPGTTLLIKDKVLWLGTSPTRIAFATADEANAFVENLLLHISGNADEGEAIFDLDKLAFIVSCEAKRNELDTTMVDLSKQTLELDEAIQARREYLEKAQKEHTELGIKIDIAKGTHAELKKVLEETELRVTAQKQRLGELERGSFVTNSKLAALLSSPAKVGAKMKSGVVKTAEWSEADEKRWRRARSRKRGEP